MVFGKASFDLLVVSAIVATTVTGHGYNLKPPAAFTTNGDKTNFMATIQANDSFVLQSGPPKGRAVEFAAALKSSKYASLKDFVQDKMVIKDPTFTRECGFTDPNAPPQPLPPQYLEFGHGPKAGFVDSHCGWCEYYCGDIRVFFDEDCPTNFPMAPAQMPYDREACLGTDMMVFYWIALHGDEFQVYINCMPLEKTTSTGAKSKYAVGSGGNNASTPSSNGRTPSPGRTGTSTPPAPGGTGNSTPPSPGGNSPPPYTPGGTGNPPSPAPGGTGNSTPPSPGGNSPPPYTPGGTGNSPSPSPGGTGNSTPPSPGGNSPPPYTPGGTGNPPSPYAPGGTGASTPPSPGGTGNSPPSQGPPSATPGSQKPGNKCTRRLESSTD